jgi:hypothetical protein
VLDRFAADEEHTARQGAGCRPHSYPRSDPLARVQKSRFLRRRGKVSNVCGDRPCFTKGWDGH